MDLDETDVAILRELQGDARLSFREVARRTGVSVPTISARVARLEELGILAGYHARVDPDRLGQTTVFLVLECRPDRVDDASARLGAIDAVRRTARLEGSRIFAEAVLPSPDAVEPLVDRVGSLPGVVAAESLVATERLKETPRAMLHEKLSAHVPCFECRRPIEGDPVTIRLGGRTHYLCCPSCETLYRERYATLKGRAKGRGAR